MSYLEIILLAIVQGLTEFLPVSSSGHLVVANAIFEQFGFPPTEDLLEVNIILHLGTLAAVLVFYVREIVRLATVDRRVVWLILTSMLPTVAIGVPLKLFYGDALESPLLAGCMFPVTAAILWWVSRRPAGGTAYQQLSFRAAFGIGCMQGLALLPGISRSGSTIAGGLLAGLDRRGAATFAFLLAIPAIAGAGVFELKDPLIALIKGETATGAAMMSTPPLVLFTGGLIAFAVGLAALWQLVVWIERGRLGIFVWYLLPLGAAVVTWQLTK